MAKQRYINTKFRSDAFVRDNLNPLDRYLFLYFLTNERTNIAWIYELPLSIISFETWIEKDNLLKMMDRLKPKIYYFDGWVYIANFQKHQKTWSEKINIWIQREMQLIPKKIIGYIEGIDRVCIGFELPIPIPIPILNIDLNSNAQSAWDIKISEKEINIPFDDFWNLYDKKIWRPKCEKKRKALSDKEREAIIDHIPKYKISQPDKKYRKNPETYFNNKSREDEIITWWLDYTSLDNFHAMMMQDRVPELKQILWLDKYLEIKKLWKQSPLYLSF